MAQQTFLKAPIASPEMQGVPVRFFKPPRPGPGLPWHALDDLYRAMRFPRSLRREALRHAQAFPDGDFETVATANGLVVIGSHSMAQGMIGAAIDAHGVPADFERAYVRAATAAWDAMCGDLDPMTKVQRLIQAAGVELRSGAST